MLIIGIAGGSGSGKTTVVQKIKERLPENAVSIVSQDAYYWDQGHLTAAQKAKINFDHPDSIEWELLYRQLFMLLKGKAVDMPVYEYVECTRTNQTIRVLPSAVLIIEGILIFTQEELRKLMDIKVFVDADADDRLARIISRDTLLRGRNVDDVLRHYESFVKPMHLQFIEPSKRYADLIIPQGGENEIAIEILTARIRHSL